ncbi:MAG: hypothetical protein R2838_17145 [Caldilineaceae bacterium]
MTGSGAGFSPGSTRSCPQVGGCHAPYAFGSFVHEEVADHSHPWPRRLLAQMDWNPEDVERRSIQGDWHAHRRTPSQVISHKVYRTPLGVTIVQVLDAPGCDGPLVQRVFVPQDDAHVEFSAHFRLGLGAASPGNVPGLPLGHRQRKCASTWAARPWNRARSSCPARAWTTTRCRIGWTFPTTMPA